MRANGRVPQANGRVPRPRRVAVLVKRFPRLSETFILNEFLELRRQGVPVELYAIMDPQERHSHPEALALLPEVKYLQTGHILRSLPAVTRTVRRHPWGATKAFAWMLTRHSRAALRNYIHAMVLVDRLADGGPAHLHAHFLHSPAAIAFIAKKISGQRYSACGHAKDIYTTLPQNLEMRCDRADFVTTCTDANRRYLVEEIGLAPSRVWLCRHGVDVDRFGRNGSATHARADPSQTHPARILSVGRLVPKKGFDLLIRACGELRRRGVEFELRIIGGGELRDELAALAEQERVADRVKLTGSMSQEDVVAELAAAELFVLSPRVMPDGDRDGIPNVLLEAMAARVPIVASAVSAIPEILTDELNARLVAPGQPKLLADVIGELLSDPEQRARLAAAGERFVREECSWPSAVQPLRELLDELLALPEPPAHKPITAVASASP